jgi:hypothetical protein
VMVLAVIYLLLTRRLSPRGEPENVGTMAAAGESDRRTNT